MLAVSLGDWELGNSGSREKPFLPATVLRRLKTAQGVRARGQVVTGGLPGLGLALEMTEDALRDASTYVRR